VPTAPTGNDCSEEEIYLFKRILKLLAYLALAGVALLAAASLYIVVGHNRPVTLPALAGPYPVGRMITQWTDTARQETLGGEAGQPRTLSVWMWYPTQPGGASLPYMPGEWARAREADRGIASLLFQAIASTHSHATDAPLASQGGPFPVLVFEPGLGPLLPEYASLTEDLASRGYVVIGLNPTYSASITMLDGWVIERSDLGTIADNATPEQAQQRGDELVEVWAADDRFAIDQATRLNSDLSSPFAGRLDLEHVGLLGHSFGGAAAFEACSLDERCTAAADVDGWPFGGVVQAGLDRPALLISSKAGSEADTPASQKANEELAAILAQAPQGYHVTIRGARHFNFTDMAVGFNPVGRPLGILGSIDGARGLRIASAYLAAFFDQTLKGQASPLLQGPSPGYPEAQFTSH
jgi:dienelactone hydrolase